MTAETVCLRCGGSRLLSAHLETPIAFCVDHDAHHGRLHLGLKADLCQDCGHVEFRVSDPAPLAGPSAAGQNNALQEEDF